MIGNLIRFVTIFVLIVAGLFTLPFGVFFWILAAMLRKRKTEVVIVNKQD